jgi:hypothetical protein
MSTLQFKPVIKTGLFLLVLPFTPERRFHGGGTSTYGRVRLCRTLITSLEIQSRLDRVSPYRC